jgi:hypothetical protein
MKLASVLFKAHHIQGYTVLSAYISTKKVQNLSENENVRTNPGSLARSVLWAPVARGTDRI